VGILSLPYAFSITGIVLGVLFLYLFAIITHHTARVLQKCLDHSIDGKQANTFGDLGFLAFGDSGRQFISIIFFLELFAACVALVILSADSIVALFPELDLTMVKVLMVAFVLPLTFPKSLSIASYGSLVGILALLNLVAILLYDGLTVKVSPGSLLNPADVVLIPADLFPIPFAFGLLMAGFSGHSVFPNIYRDMKAPEQYPKLVNYTYLIIVSFYTMIAATGYMMFGSSAMHEVILSNPDNPKPSIDSRI
jgi:vesicular inhibitory amino acid transporter